MPFDLLIVGAGPAGLSAAIRFAQLCRQHERPFSAAVVDKGAEVGAHILSGCVLEPRGMDELFPEWRERTGQPLLKKKTVSSADPALAAAQRKNDEDAAAIEAANAPLAEQRLWSELPLRQLVTQDRFFMFTGSGKSVRMPCPPQMKSRGKGYVVSLSQLCRWLGRAAEALGVGVLPGFAGKELLFSWDGAVAGVATGDLGLDKAGKPIPGKFTPGVDLLARVTLLAEGARGSLTAEAEAAFGLRAPGGAGGGAASGAAWGARPVGGDELEEAREAAIQRARALPPPPAPKPPPGGRRGPAPLSAEEAAVPPATTLAGGGRCGQTYALGVKEVWEVDPSRHVPGTVWHTVGYPLPHDVYGGGFVYHMGPEPDEEGFVPPGGAEATTSGDADDATTTPPATTQTKVPGRCRVALGLVVGLDYSDPNLSPFGEFQRFKRHPAVAELLRGGRCVQYGARVLNEGGLQSVPGLIFPGGALIGCSAGFLNVPKIKGTHTAMKSGILAAEEAFRALCEADDKAKRATAEAAAAGQATADAAQTSSSSPSPPATPVPTPPILLDAYPARLNASWVAEELRAARNIRPGFRFGLLPGLLNAALSTYIFRGREPWTLSHPLGGGQDNAALRERLASEKSPDEFEPEKRYPKPDGSLAFDLPTSLFRSGTNHDHQQPCHLILTKGEEGMRRWNYERYAKGPEARYCPAGVYEWGEQAVEEEGGGGRGSGAGAAAAERGKDKAAVPRLTINAQNCLHCKACDVKDVKRNIRWTPPEGGGGPAYTIM
jgi:flavin-dependent dehydrogenase